MGKLTTLFKFVAVLFIVLSLGGAAVVNAQGGSANSNRFTGSCATTSYATVTNDSLIFYAPEQFSTVTDAFLRAGTTFLVCTDISLAGWTAFKITPQTAILWVPTGTFAGFSGQGGFGNQTAINNQAGNQVANNRGSQQSGFANQNTAGGITGTSQNGFGNNQGNNQNTANNNQNGFGNGQGNSQNGFSNNQNTANNNQNGFGNGQGNSQNGFSNNQNTANNNQNGFGNNQNTANNQNGFGNNQGNSQNGFSNNQNTANNSQNGFGNGQNTANNSQGGFGNGQGNNRNNFGVGQNNNLGSSIGVNRTLPVGTIGVCANTSDYHMVLRDVEINYAPQFNSGTGQFLRPGSVFAVCGDSNIQGWIAFKITPQSAIYFVPSGTFG